MKRPDEEIGPPPPSLAVAGRMNAAGIAVFYGATDPSVALSGLVRRNRAEVDRRQVRLRCGRRSEARY
jgi:hypothetical protein